jgi:hypothetical protein
MPQVTLLNIADSLEAIALRAALEWWAIEVTLHHVGSAAQLVTLLKGATPLSPLVVLLCHGDERGILLPECAAELAATQPFDGLGPDDLRQFVRLPGSVVVNTGCATGTPAFAAAFRASGARTYIGPTGYPDGSASLFYCLALIYAHLVRGQSLAVAHAQAAAHDAETAQFRLFESAM